MIEIKYLNVNEVLDIIDNKSGYNFKGKDKDDHLITRKTWNKYVREFKQEKKFNDEMIKGSKRYTKYRYDFVEKIIDYRETLLKQQYNSSRKTTINYEKIATYEMIAEATGTKVDKSIYKEKIPITQYKKIQKYKNSSLVPELTNKEIENVKNNLIEAVIYDLIDMERIIYDTHEHIISGYLHYGNAKPLKMIEDEDGKPLGFQRDSKKYLKQSVIDELINHHKKNNVFFTI